MHASARTRAWGWNVLVSTCVVFSVPLGAQQTVPDTTGVNVPKAPTVQPAAPAPIQQPPPASNPAPASDRKFTVSRFDFSGNTVYSTETLSALINDYLGRQLTLAQVYEAADKVTHYYYEHGYTLASATLPAQKISDGTVRLEVIEGRIAAVKVEGASRYKESQITANLAGVHSGEIYRGSSLEAGLWHLNALPGLQAKALVQPGDSYGSSNLLIQVQERPFTASLSGDNYGRENLGVYRGALSATANNPLRLADQLQAVFLQTEGSLLQYGYLGYSLPLWNSGPRLSASYAEGKFTLAGLFSGVDGRNRTTRGGLNYLFADSRTNKFDTGIAVNHIQANANLVGQQISETNLTLFELSNVYSHAWENLASTQAALTLQSNFKQATPADPANEKLRTELDLQHAQPIYGRLDAYVHGNYVYSQDPLPDVTQVSLGGPSSVRGYPAAEVRGDRGTFASGGLRQGFRLGPTDWAGRVFADTGQVKRANGGAESLSSAGVGLDFQWPVSHLVIGAKADWSFVLDHHNDTAAASTHDDQRVFATVSVSY